MYRLLTIVIFTISCATDHLIDQCPTECYGFRDYADPDTQGIGECKAGKPVCDKDLKVIDCEGEVLPSDEICDGKDNDCDWRSDEDWNDEPLEAYGSNDTCPTFGECAKYNAICRDGEYICPYQPRAEICDGKDNDCNSLIDDGLGNTELCFDDDFHKATNGICRPGVVRCVQGEIVCDGQVLPTTEICDEEDNDCNGIADDTNGVLSSYYDVVIAVDTSASMCNYIQAVAGGLYTYIEQFQNNPYFRWALVGMSEDNVNNVQTILDFTDIASIQLALTMIGCNGTGFEASLDVLYNTCSYTGGDLGLSWRENANALVFSFTDEPAQTYTTPPTDELMIINACLDNGVIPFQWSRNPEQFAPIVEQSNGIHFDLSESSDQILNDLNSIVMAICE